MRMKNDKLKMGICKICREFKVLTEEHIPPKSAFNTGTIKIYSADEAMKTICEKGRDPWDFEGLKYKLKQGGKTYYTLCSKCNSYTGTNYVDYYQNIVKSFAVFLKNLDLNKIDVVTANTERFRPLPFIKQVLTMFASFTDITKNEEIKKFILNKGHYKVNLNNLKIYMSIFKAGMQRTLPWTVLVTNKGHYLVSEIVSFPFIFVLLGNADKVDIENCKNFGVDISSFVDYSYDQEITLEIHLPIHECNINFPCDYRNKEEIKKCQEENKH